MSTSVPSRTSLGSGEGRRSGPQRWVLVEGLTQADTGHRKEQSDRKVSKPGGRRGREGRRETHPGRSAGSRCRKHHTVTQAGTKTPSWEARPSPHLQLCWRTWVTAPGWRLLTEGLQHPPPQQTTGQGLHAKQQEPWKAGSLSRFLFWMPSSHQAARGGNGIIGGRGPSPPQERSASEEKAASLLCGVGSSLTAW